MKNIHILLLVLTVLISVQLSCNQKVPPAKEKVLVTHYTDVVTEEDNSFEEMEKFDAYVKNISKPFLVQREM